MLFTLIVLVVLTIVLTVLLGLARDDKRLAMLPVLAWGYLRLACGRSLNAFWTEGIFAVTWIDAVVILILLVMIGFAIASYLRLRRE